MLEFDHERNHRSVNDHAGRRHAGAGWPEEDTSGSFKHGGWTVPYADEYMGKVLGEELGHPFDLLLGRKTYDIWKPYWPLQKGFIAEAFNSATK